MKTSTIRTRWAAIGAAVAITLGAGGIGLVSATSPDGAVAYVPVEPCRIADTRPDPTFNVGPRSTPIGADEIHVIAAHGDNGDCTGIPTSATGLQLNVTALNASQNTFVTVWGEGARPNASSLNPAVGQPPTPNAVTTGLTATGRFNVFNRFGNVDIIADVVGFYTDHQHDGGDIIDGSLTGADIEDGSVAGIDITDESVTGTDIDDNTVSNLDTSNEPGVSYTNDPNTVVVGTANSVVSSVLIRPPSVGFVTVDAAADWFTGTAGRQLQCQITDGTDTIDGSLVVNRDTSATTSALAQSISLVQTFPVDRFIGSIFSGQSFNLVCAVGPSGDVSVRNVHMTATFVSTSYAPLSIIFPIVADPAGVNEGAPAN